jgi:hypothetical protein
VPQQINAKVISHAPRIREESLSRMPRRKLPKNAPCPCGSGKKYKHCCYGKGFDYLEDEEGNIFRDFSIIIG